MKQIPLKQELMLKKVVSLYQHPSGYISVLHKEDNNLYLYDEKTMTIMAASNRPLNQDIQLLTFTQDFNVFYVYCGQQQQRMMEKQEKSKCYRFQQDKEGKLIYTKHNFYRNSTKINLNLTGITYFPHQSSQSHDNYLIGWNKRYYYFISEEGEIINQSTFIINSKDFYIDSSQVYSANIIIVICQNVLRLVRIHFNYMEVLSQLTLASKITQLFLEKKANARYVMLISEGSNILVRISNLSFIDQYKIQNGNSSYKKICFLSPGIDVSATSKTKNHVFLIYQTNTQNKQEQRSNREYLNRSFLRSGNNSLKNQEKYVYIIELNLQNVHQNKESRFKVLRPEKQFYFSYQSNILDLFYNQNDENYIRIINTQSNLMKINLYAIYQNTLIGQQWANLGFSLIPTSKNVYYEESEDQFELIKKKNLQKLKCHKRIEQSDLNDWSFSLFNGEQLKKIKNNRIRLSFFD